MIAQVGARFMRVDPEGDRFDHITLIGVAGPSSFVVATDEFGSPEVIDYGDLVSEYGATGIDAGRSEAEIQAEVTLRAHREAVQAYFGREIAEDEPYRPYGDQGAN
jgi:hypothetical protein